MQTFVPSTFTEILCLNLTRYSFIPSLPRRSNHSYASGTLSGGCDVGSCLFVSDNVYVSMNVKSGQQLEGLTKGLLSRTFQKAFVVTLNVISALILFARYLGFL